MPYPTTATTLKLLPSKFLTLTAACIWLLGSGAALLAAGGKISGQVTNGTTGAPVSNQTLQLLMPRGGMQQVATAVTDSNGQFVVAASDLATDSFYLLQAAYQGVNYHAAVKFDDRGQARADITVYDATRTAPPLRIESARIILRAEGDKVHVQEMFAIRNAATPPRSYVNPDGTFLFHLAKTTGEPTAAVAGLMNMPLPAAREPRQGAGEFQYSVPSQTGPDRHDGRLRRRLRLQQTGPRGLRRLSDRRGGAAGFAPQSLRGLPAIQGGGRRCGDGKPEIFGGKRAAQRPTRRERQW